MDRNNDFKIYALLGMNAIFTLYSGCMSERTGNRLETMQQDVRGIEDKIDSQNQLLEKIEKNTSTTAKKELPRSQNGFYCEPPKSGTNSRDGWRCYFTY